MNIKIYFNDVVLGDTPRIRPNCPFIQAPLADAKEIAREKIKSGEWASYLIPDLHETTVIIEEDI